MTKRKNFRLQGTKLYVATNNCEIHIGKLKDEDAVNLFIQTLADTAEDSYFRGWNDDIGYDY